jgi:hypothetical protein
MKAKTICEIEQIKHKHTPFVNDKTLKYLDAINDAAQYPGARVAVDYSRITMYQCSASSAVESMNQANKAARDRTAVDVVCATKLLLSLPSKRYHEKKEMAWKWQGHLTPYSEVLQDKAFENINFFHYSINITEQEIMWEYRVTRNGKGNNKRNCFFLKEPNGRSMFGGCSCGSPYTGGIPCRHMVAAVKSSIIEGLTATNSMPVWWTTECWCNQYSADTNETCHFDMDTLRLTPEDAAMRYCWPYAAPRKAGRPKNNKRMKNPLEGKKKRNSTGSTREAMVDDNEEEEEEEGDTETACYPKRARSWSQL